MTAEQVIVRLEMWVNFGFKWIAAGTGGFHYWATDKKDKPHPEFMTCGLCCFHLPLAAGVEVGALNRDRAGDLIVDQMLSGQGGKEPKGWAPGGLTQYRSSGIRSNTPGRGDIVFFSGTGAKYFAHVAVATGNGSDVISFGHDAPYLQGGMHTRLVEKLTIERVKQINTALTTVHFGAPSW